MLFMNRLRFSFLVVLLVWCGVTMQAQEVLTLEQAIDIALKNNYDIRISKNDAEIASRNNTAGNAGMLPKVTGVLSDNYTLSHLNQQFTSGLEVNKNNVGA